MAKPESSGRFQVALELWRGDVGVLSVGHSPGRAAILRRIEAKPPWTDALLDGLAASAEAARPIHHPSLLAVIGHERTPDSLTVATEYVQGVPLMTLLARAKERKRPMPPTVAQRIVLDLARALGQAEELLKAQTGGTIAWVHPECVFISSGDDALIADIGLVSLADLPEHPSVVAYRAPELLARGARPTRGAPVYSLGILLWELLAGRDALGQAAPGASLASVRQRAAGGGIPRLDLVTRNLPSLLVEITMQSVHRDPRARFPTVQAFAEALAAGKRSRGGEIVTYLNELCLDLVDKQKSALLHTSIAPASWRPTVHALESEPPQIPRAPRLIGLAAYLNPTEPEHVEVAVESSRRGDELLPPAASAPNAEPARDAIPLEVRAAEAVPLVTKPEPRSTLPLLLVNKPPQAGPAFSSVDGTTSFDARDVSFRPRRRMGLVFFVLLVLGGAGTLIYFAVQKQLDAANGTTASTPVEAVAAVSASGAGVLPGTTPESSASSAAQRAKLRERVEFARRQKDRDAASPASAASAGESEPNLENPYVDKPKTAPSAVPSATRDRGF